MRTPDEPASGSSQAVKIQRLLKGSYRTLGSKAPLPPFTADQKVLRATRLNWLPLLFWIRTSLLTATMRWLGPTVPSVSGGMTVLLSSMAWKLAAMIGACGVGTGISVPGVGAAGGVAGRVGGTA